MLFKITVTWRDRRKLLFPVIKTKTIVKSDTEFPVGHRGFMAIWRWAESEFPGTTLSFDRLDVVNQEQAS